MNWIIINTYLTCVYIFRITSLLNVYIEAKIPNNFLTISYKLEIIWFEAQLLRTVSVPVKYICIEIAFCAGLQESSLLLFQLYVLFTIYSRKNRTKLFVNVIDLWNNNLLQVKLKSPMTWLLIFDQLRQLLILFPINLSRLKSKKDRSKIKWKLQYRYYLSELI